MRLGVRLGIQFPQGVTQVAIASVDSLAIVGADTTVSGTCPPGQTVVVTVGGEAFGTDTTTSDGTWSITAECPDVEGTSVAVVATAGGVVATSAINYVVAAQVDAWIAGLGETRDAAPNDDRINTWTGVVNGYEVTQASDSLKPTGDGTIVQYDGDDDYLLNASAIGSAYGDNVQDFWVAFVFKYDGVSADTGLLNFGGTARRLILGYSIVLASGGLFADINAGDTRAYDAFTDTASYHVAVLQASGGAGGAMTIWLDGAEFASDTIDGAGLDLDGLSLHLGARYTGGVYKGHDGSVKAVLLGTTLTTAQRQRLEAALTAEYL